MACSGEITMLGQAAREARRAGRVRHRAAEEREAQEPLAWSLSVLAHLGLAAVLATLTSMIATAERAEIESTRGEQVVVASIRLTPPAAAPAVSKPVDAEPTPAPLEAPASLTAPRPLEELLTDGPVAPKAVTVRGEARVTPNDSAVPDTETPQRSAPEAPATPPVEVAASVLDRRAPPTPELELEMRPRRPLEERAPSSPSTIGVTGAAAALDRPVPHYPALSRRAGEEGLVVLEVSIDAGGRVREVRTLRSPGYPRPPS